MSFDINHLSFHVGYASRGQGNSCASRHCVLNSVPGFRLTGINFQNYIVQEIGFLRLERTGSKEYQTKPIRGDVDFLASSGARRFTLFFPSTQ
jgi:hypothetical protein